MSTETKKTRTPKLRFPEFRKAGAWAFKNGDKVFNQISNKNHNSDLPILAITQEHGAIPRNEIDYSVIVTDKSVESYKVVEVGDFIISLRSFQGGIEYSNYKGICSPAYIILRKKIEVEDFYFKYYFKTDIFIRDLTKNIEGIRDGKMVSFKQFSDLLLPLPTPPEQQKIAATLTSLDEVLAAQSEKIKALQAHKKGLMQQLFPAEGERVPRVRFGEFEGEWKEKTLGDKNIALFVKEKTPLEKLKLESYVSTENLLPDYAGVTIASKLPPSGSFTQYKAGDILISNIRPYLKKIWAADKEGAASNDVIVIRAGSAVSDLFLSFILKNDSFINFVMEGAKGLKMPRGDKSLMEEYRITFPTKPEQQKIAACLASLDELIAAESEKLEALKAQKKGLMQGLFPGGGGGDDDDVY